jgi:hypothetical protein
MKPEARGNDPEHLAYMLLLLTYNGCELLDLCGVGLTPELVMYTPHAAFITRCK